MTDFLLRLIQALLSSLYVVLGRVPAIEQLRRAFAGAGGGVAAERLLLMVLLAAVLGVVLFLLFLRFLRRAPGATGSRTLRELFRGSR